MNQALIEITKQGAVAVEEIKFTPPKGSSNNSSSCNSPATPSSKSVKSNQANSPSPSSQQNQLLYSINSLNPYYTQQVLQRFQQPHSFVKQVHVVVKNTPFGVTLKTNDLSKLNFHNYVVKATLLYDSDPPKHVDFIHNEPLQYVATVNDDGSEVTVDVKVGILSSQHQGSMFLVVLHITHTSSPSPSNQEPISTILNHINSNSIHSQSLSHLVVVSHPIRIVSKVDHVKKEGVPILKKKTFHEILTDKLKKLSKSQEGQSKWIKNLYEQHHINFDMEPYNSKKHENGSPSSSSSTPCFGSSTPFSLKNEDDSDSDSDSDDFERPQKKLLLNNNINNIQNNNINNNQNIQTNSLSQNSNNFQNSFNRVVEAFKSVNENDRKETIKNMVQLLKSDDLEQLVKTFMDELGNVNDDSSSTSTECNCENCPSKKELERFQGLCMNFLTPTTNIGNNTNNSISAITPPTPSAAALVNGNLPLMNAESLLLNNPIALSNHHHHHLINQNQSDFLPLPILSQL
ncbi:hypothetical protein CYY_001607 [Polysphondylium violaceum]|uniref:Transcriptional regulator n=1 Tax=Polysphondylium violaceum TaxID=133409 RepID=A0A8J4V3Z8_9MYCE|nr:hypothetical protein CYY_001607 [Polysphondylium violaceum]